MDGKPQKWGYSVGLNDESFRWIKVLLEENHKYATTVEPVKDSNTLLRKVDKTAQAVVADYLRLLWEYTLDDIKKFHPDYQDIYALRVVLTVPAIWSPTAKDKTLKAARTAGMPGNIRLVTEPEAAALATLKDKADDNTLKVRRKVIFVDSIEKTDKRLPPGRRCFCCMRCRRWHSCIFSARLSSLCLVTGF